MTQTLTAKVRDLLASERSRSEKLQAICQLLADAVPHYDWVGFYLVEEGTEESLVLGPYVGEPTEHTRIAFGQGICGQAAATESLFLIQDVTKEENYLSCSPEVKAEIVVPIFRGEALVGELDIDSHTRAAFSAADRELLEEIAILVGGIL